eukprot:12441182-Alexandrium_andersonii.AAC.1
MDADFDFAQPEGEACSEAAKPAQAVGANGDSKEEAAADAGKQQFVPDEDDERHCLACDAPRHQSRFCKAS